MKKHTAKSIILVLLGSVIFSGCMVGYRDAGYRRDHNDHHYRDRDDRHYQNRDNHNDGYNRDRDYNHN